MDPKGHGRAFCPSTGLAVPECSCRRCLEEMLHRFRPELVRDEIRISRNSAPRGERSDVQRDHLG